MSRSLSWKPIAPLDPTRIPLNGRVAALDALRAEWEAQLARIPEEDRRRRRQRTLRKLSIETGIIERIYEIDWGLTLTLVAEGFTRDVIERAGGKLDDVTLATLNAQRDALEMVVDFVRDQRKLSASFIKELHHAVTRTQRTYTATDALGQVVERELQHGRWKQWPNHVTRQDGSTLEYCPPEHLDSEIDNLTAWYEELKATPVHPLVEAAWLHHRFVQIHPFADGNGRVARALTLLVLQRHHYPPLVVDRFHRDRYLKALDRANEDDLTPLVTLFTILESSAIASELESALEPERGTSSSVAHTLAAQLAARRDQDRTRRRQAMEVRALAIAKMTSHWIRSKRTELLALFAEQGLHDIRISDSEATSANPEYPSGLRGDDALPKHLWYRRQVVQSARRAGHYADFGGFVGLSTLRVQIGGIRLVFLASIHGAGADTGVFAVTSFASLRLGGRGDGNVDDMDFPTSSDSFRVVHTESMEAINERYAELADQLDEGLSVALVELMKYV